MFQITKHIRLIKLSSICSNTNKYTRQSQYANLSSFAGPSPVRPLQWPERPPIITNNVYDSFMSAVGNTSLIRLRYVSELTGCNIYGKCEYENPGGSVKDRAAMQIIKQAEIDNILVSGESGLIVEGTAGNTGIGLTYCGNARGYKTIIVIADTQSIEKKNTLRFGGAELLEVPAVPFKNPNNYVHVAHRLANILKDEYKNKKRQERILYANQWDNLANRQAHIETTGPEIYAQLDGKIDGFNCATGTGGTLSGIAEYLRSKDKNIKIALTDPAGAGLVHYYNHGALKATGDSISEGIGQNRITGNMAYNDFRPDYAIEITDQEALPIMNDLLQYEGLCVGSSSAINVAGAVRLAKILGPGKTIVTVLCDSGIRYSNKIYNPTFLRSRSLPVPVWLDNENEQKQQFRADLEKRLKLCME